MATMKAPPGMTSFSHGGVVHQVAEDGLVEVSGAAIAELKAHGLTVAEVQQGSKNVSVTPSKKKGDVWENMTTGEKWTYDGAQWQKSTKPKLRK